MDASTGKLRHTIALPNVHELVFSPKGSYLNTWERPWKNEEDGSAGKNFKVWSMASGEQIIEFVQKSQNGWSLQYSQDEKICCRNVTNEVHIYESANMQNGIFSVSNSIDNRYLEETTCGRSNFILVIAWGEPVHRCLSP